MAKFIIIDAIIPFIGPRLQITLETAIRVRPDVPDGTLFDITVDVKPVNPSSGWDQTYLGRAQAHLELATPTLGDIPTTAVVEADVALVAGVVNDTVPVPISTAQKQWLPFTITVPKYTVAPVTVRMNSTYNLLRKATRLSCVSGSIHKRDIHATYQSN